MLSHFYNTNQFYGVELGFRNDSNFMVIEKTPYFIFLKENVFKKKKE